GDSRREPEPSHASDAGLIQIPLPPGDPPTIEIPLPTALETWRDLYLQSAMEKSIVFFLCALLLYLVTRMIRRGINSNIEDVNRRHQLRTWVNYGYVSLLLLIAIAMFGNWLSGLGTILALLVAG